MDSNFLAGIIGALGTIIAALMSVLLAPLVSSKMFRSRYRIPVVLGTWNNKWFIDDNLDSEDTFEIKKWTSKNHFRGDAQHPKGPYIISGEISAFGTLVITYKDANFPTMSYIGTCILKLSVDGKSMEGYWHGLTTEGKIEGGKIVCKRA